MECARNVIVFVLLFCNVCSLDQAPCDPTHYLELGKRGMVLCSFEEGVAISWYNSSTLVGEYPLIHYTYPAKDGEGYTSGEFDIYPNGSLVIEEVSLRHEHEYSVQYLHSTQEDPVVIFIEVVVIVNPNPLNPVIKGCNQQQTCELEVDYEGNITCTVYEIRPEVQLEWIMFSEKESSMIDFENHQFSTVTKGDLFEISITSMYRVIDRSISKMTVECRITGSEIWDLKTKFDLHFVSDGDITEEDASKKKKKKKKMMSLIVLIVPLVLAVLCGLCIIRKVMQMRKGKRQRKQSSVPVMDKQEAEEMLQIYQYDDDEIMRKKQLFVDQIQRKYETWCNLIQPIPYIKDKLYCVDTVFVETGLEFLSSSSTSLGDQKVWTRFQSYQDIFQDPRIKSRRLILEGEPGYGKSTLTLQFAYDWCNMVPASPLRDVEIFILLRLRQLSGVKSIYRAIKQFLLPVDSTLSEEDVKSVLQNSCSTVIILDGFDEYPETADTADSEEVGDVMNIIRFEMFQDFDVVVTTRSSFLPTRIPPQTQRVRLTGFDDNARSCYIRKAVVGDDDEAANGIERNLRENAILSDLCQVPLLFVIFAHMTHERDQFLRLNSVTSFFRYMIASFHSHMKNKMDNHKAIRAHERFENNHSELDKVAFEALGGNNQRIVWRKQELTKEIGQEFYDQYSRTGILVEEEVMEMIDDPNFITTGPIHYTIEVRFYHKLFCEWYAAHYLSDYLRQSPSAELNKFLPHLDPYNLQYLYRFTCGLNPDCAEKIIDYLTKIEGGDKFAILCILEQRGKTDDVKESIRILCTEGMVISGCDSLLLQRSSTQILEIASRNKIPIEYLQLHMCFASVDLPRAAILMDSGLHLSSDMQVKRLGVDLLIREMTIEEVEEIFKFALMCPNLEMLVIGGCMAPRSFKVGPVLSSLQSKNVQVRWKCSSESPIYILNLLSGLWENKDDGSQLTDGDFAKMWQLREDTMREWTEQDYMQDLKQTRDYLSRKVQGLPT